MNNLWINLIDFHVCAGLWTTIRRRIIHQERTHDGQTNEPRTHRISVSQEANWGRILGNKCDKRFNSPNNDAFCSHSIIQSINLTTGCTITKRATSKSSGKCATGTSLKVIKIVFISSGAYNLHDLIDCIRFTLSPSRWLHAR